MAVLAVMFLFCCSDPAEDDVTPPPTGSEEEEEVISVDADVALKAFSFKDAIKKTGKVPSGVNSSLLKTNSSDTLYVLPDVINLIRISHPKTPVKGMYIAVTGSTFYYDVPIFEMEETDTVSVIVFEISLDEIDEFSNSQSMPLEITAYDDNGEPIDIIERIVTVERPGTTMCDIRQDGDTVLVDYGYGWQWLWTALLDHNDQPTRIFAPYKSYLTTQNHSGCCDDGSPCPTLVIDPNTKEAEWIYHSEFSVSTYYSIDTEVFLFFKDGTFSRYTVESQSALNSDKTDWCNGVPSMTQYGDVVFYYGTHDYTPGDTRLSYQTTRSVCDDPLGLCGYGSRSGNLINSCHAMMITAGAENQREVRMYIKRYGRTDVVMEGEILKTIWKD